MLKRVTPMLQASDLDATIAFYRDVLGFTLDGTYPDDTPTWCHVCRDDVHLMFYVEAEHEHDEGEDHDHHHGPPSLTGVLYFYPEDVDALWVSVKDRAPVAWPVQDMPYGMREFAIRDPNGYTLSFGQET